jgi:NADPH2:quinone reductase
MRAVWYDRQGAADEALVCGELPTPDAGYGEVRVKLEASGVNPSDTYRRRGPPAMEYPRVITNSDGAGVIDQVGPAVDKQWLGKRVWLYNGQRNGRWMGTAAEYIALSVDLVTELPDHVSFAEGATLGVPAMTAHRAVFVGGPVQGKTLLVTGGAGAVGHYAVQLANWAGATVIATVSSAERPGERVPAALRMSSTTAPRTLPPGSSTLPAGLVSITSPRLISAATWPRRCAA